MCVCVCERERQTERERERASEGGKRGGEGVRIQGSGCGVERVGGMVIVI